MGLVSGAGIKPDASSVAGIKPDAPSGAGTEAERGVPLSNVGGDLLLLRFKEVLRFKEDDGSPIGEPPLGMVCLWG